MLIRRNQAAFAAIAVVMITLLASAVFVTKFAVQSMADRSGNSSGKADAEVRGPRNGFDEALFPQLARRAEVEAASPIVEVEAPVVGGAGTIRVIGIDPFRAIRLQPGMTAFLQQSMFEAAPMDDSIAAMGQALEGA